MNYYPNIKALRIQYNYKQAYVGDILGITQPEYSKLESGQRKIDSRFIKELCKLYDVNADILLKQNPTSQHLSTEHMIRMAGHPEISHDILAKIIDNYSSILENFTRQQHVQEKIIDKLMNENKQEEIRPAEDHNAPEE